MAAATPSLSRPCQVLESPMEEHVRITLIVAALALTAVVGIYYTCIRKSAAAPEA